MRLTYLVLHVQCWCNTVLVYLPKPAVLAVGCCLFSSREAGSVSISYSASVDDVLGLQVDGTTLRQVTASAEGVGDVDRRPSSLRLCDVKGYCTCTSFNYRLLGNQQYVVNKKQCNALYLSRSVPSQTSLGTFFHMVVSLHVQYVGHTGLPPIQNCSSRVATMSSM